MKNIKIKLPVVVILLAISISGIFFIVKDAPVGRSNSLASPRLGSADKSKDSFSLVAKAKKSKRKTAKKPAQKKKPGKKQKGKKQLQKTPPAIPTNIPGIDAGTLPEGFPANIPGIDAGALPEGLPQAGSNDFMQQMMQQMMGQGGLGGATSGTGATFDIVKEPLPKIAVANFIDLNSIQRISKFRGGYGHDYSLMTGETCRSMKHYFWPKGGDPGTSHTPSWMTIGLYAPADGTIERIQISDGSSGKEAQFSLVVDVNKAFKFGFHHVRLEAGIINGSQVKAGQKLGTIGNEQNHGEIAVEIMTPKGRALVSFFEVATDEVLKAYAARGLTNIKNAIHTKEERDAKPLTCDKNTQDGRFTGGDYSGMTDSAGMANWVELN